MLKNIPSVLSPDLLKTLMEMGHGDELVLSDGNFPAASLARRLVRCDGSGVPELLDAILQFFPLDTYVEEPVNLMAVVPGDPIKPEIWNVYRDIICRHEPVVNRTGYLERQAFYKRAGEAYAIISTGETALYGNVILKKGVVV